MSRNPNDLPRGNLLPSSGPPDIDSDRPTNVRWMVFALSCATSWILYLHRYTFALIKPELIEEWGLNESQLGLLDSAFSLFYFVCQVPVGILADVIGAHYVLVAIVVLWSFALEFHALAPSMMWLRGARALFGAAQAGAFATLSRITQNWFPAQSRTSIQGWVGVFFGRMGGVFSGLLLATVLMGLCDLDWRSAIYVFTTAGVVLGILILLLFRNTPRLHPSANEAEADLIEGKTSEQSPDKEQPEPVKQKRMTVSQMFKRMSPRSIFNLLTLNASTFFSTVADNVYSAWIPLFLRSIHKLEYKEMGIYWALPLLGGALGGAFGGYLNDRFIRQTANRRWSRALVALTGKGMAGVTMFAALLFIDQPYIFCSLLFFVKFFGDWSLVTSWGVVTDIGGRATATVFSFNNSIASTGAILAPIMYGWVAQEYGWSPVFTIVGVSYFICAATWLLINCTIPLVAEKNPADDQEQPEQETKDH